MANLTKTADQTKGLKQVATQIKNAALFFAPKKTGNLKRALNTANRPESMVKVTNIGGGTRFTFSLIIAPSGAEYGKFWNSPNVSSTVRKGKTPNVPRSIDYGMQAVNDKSVKTEIDRLIGGYTDALIGEKVRVLVGGKLEKGFQQLSSIK
jgi:hypothetical protein